MDRDIQHRIDQGGFYNLSAVCPPEKIAKIFPEGKTIIPEQIKEHIEQIKERAQEIERLLNQWVHYLVEQEKNPLT